MKLVTPAPWSAAHTHVSAHTGRHSLRRFSIALLALSLPLAASARAGSPEGDARQPLVDRLVPTALRALAGEVMTDNPDLARLRAAAEAARAEAPQVAALPDPTAAVTAYLLSPETRVGPQRLMLSLAQRLPWFGTLTLRQRAAVADAAAAHARVDATALGLLTEMRRLLWELHFLDRWEEIARQDRDTLSHYEDLARARYASGAGDGQSVVKLQAEITRASSRLLEIAQRRASVSSRLNALRGRPAEDPLPRVVLDPVQEALPPTSTLVDMAMDHRPELAASSAEMAAAEARIELARKRSLPDLTIGLTYGLVGRRDDPAGRANPPDGNGRDVLGLTAGATLPVHGEANRARVEQAVQRHLAAGESRRAAIVDIEQQIGDLGQRIPLLHDQLDLLDTLHLQARESLRTAESGYAAGTTGALDLLDAERVLLEVRKARARVEADLAIAVARLEGAVGTALRAVPGK